MYAQNSVRHWFSSAVLFVSVSKSADVEIAAITGETEPWNFHGKYVKKV